MNSALEIVRIVLIVALLCVAGALVTPRGRIPLALRGLAKVLRQDTVPGGDAAGTVSRGKRLLSFVLIFLAILLALI